jgi:hypothetical protein
VNFRTSRWCPKPFNQTRSPSTESWFA